MAKETNGLYETDGAIPRGNKEFESLGGKPRAPPQATHTACDTARRLLRYVLYASPIRVLYVCWLLKDCGKKPIYSHGR
jgi:hypothetical protein